ncbi:MAG: N-acetylmuramic acid 6-phosphate etherase [Thermoguttaceae bacterium]|nr:N-acetylmuramic acid 6-phosphate etherase [Thermoguttaceae bacterium]MDW8077389.1 N-acetylmuramic acid 6-phosphate etherase [Thermoguttaceae bacterium]
MSDLGRLTTETPNPASARLDELSPIEIVRLMNAEDAKVAPAVGREAEKIATAIEVIAERLRGGGRLIYLGAGTSGRLGVIDAAECPPTFSTPPEMVVGVIAGGPQAMFRSVEGAEDIGPAAVDDLKRIGLGSRDVLVGIATSGRTPYVVAGLRYAREVGAFAIGLTCNEGADLEKECDLVIAPVVGPEVLAGSTRLKAGTATKMVLNMLTTGAMVRLGKTYGNLMVDLRATNSKLMDRARRIVSAVAGISRQEAEELLRQCDGEVKTAIVMHRFRISPHEARRHLATFEGRLRQALENPPSLAAEPSQSTTASASTNP